MADATRPTRADEVRQERRRKPGSTSMVGLKLTVDESKLDRENYSYRWVNDQGGRMAQLRDNDWDPAPEQAVPNGDGPGTVGAKVAGTDESGKPFNAVLMRKRKDWFDADYKEKMAPLDEMDKAIRAGVNVSKEAALQDGVYTPDGGNKLG